MHKTILTELQFEGTTPLLQFDIESELAAGFKPESLTLTLFDALTGSIVNSRNNQDVLSSCDASGHVTLWLEPEDLTFVNPANSTETRRALFRWTWNAGARVGAHEVEFPVENHGYLP